MCNHHPLHHPQITRLNEELRRADEARADALRAADSANLAVLQLEQRIGQLSADKQAAGGAVAAAEARAAGVERRLAALEKAFDKERRSWQADAAG